MGVCGEGEGLDGERLARARISIELRARLDISGHSPSKQPRYEHESPLNASRFEPSFGPETVSYSSRPKLDFATSRFGTESSPNRDPIFGCVHRSNTAMTRFYLKQTKIRLRSLAGSKSAVTPLYYGQFRKFRAQRAALTE